MPVTTLFDGTNNLFDPVIFDTVIRYTVDIVERQTLFDSAVFDSVPFDTANGGAIVVDDLLARVQNLNTALSESTSVGAGTITKQIAKAIAETATTISDSLSRLLASLRSLTESETIGAGNVATLRPSSVRYLYDLGALFDSVKFSEPPFDVTVKSYPITDSVSRGLNSARTITESSISIGVGVVTRLLGATRSISESITVGAGTIVKQISKAISDSVAIGVGTISRTRLITRALSEAISLSDSVTRTYNPLRTISDSISVGAGTIGKAISKSITESTITIGDSVSRSMAFLRSILNSVTVLAGTVTGGWGTARIATAYITKRAGDSSITKRTADVKVTELY